MIPQSSRDHHHFAAHPQVGSHINACVADMQICDSRDRADGDHKVTIGLSQMSVQKRSSSMHICGSERRCPDDPVPDVQPQFRAYQLLSSVHVALRVDERPLNNKK
jgi:hypothetical protein